MALPVIGYDNILRRSSTIASTPAAESGFTTADLKDYRAYKIWKSSAISTPQDIDIDMGASGSDDADFIALVNHNLKAEGATVEVLADTFTPPTTQRLAPYTPVSDVADYKPFTVTSTLRYWRVRLAKGGGFVNKPYIGELLIGRRTTLTEYAAPGFDPFMKEVKAISARSKGGHYLGGFLQGVERRAEIHFGGEAGAARAAFTSDLNAFLDNHALKRLPFIFVLDTDDADLLSARWVKVPDDDHPHRTPVGNSYSRFALNLPVEEAIMEVA